MALIDRYLHVRATRLARGTIAEYRADLAHFTGSLRRHSLATATPTDVATWFQTFTRDDDDPDDRRRWSLRTAHRRRAALFGFYQWARRERLVRTNPVEPIELPRFYPRPVKLVSLADIERVFAFAESQLAQPNPCEEVQLTLNVAVLRLMERLALRVSEAANIRLSRLTTVDGELRAWVSKKGHKPKTYPIAGAVALAFVRWLNARAALRPEAGHEDYVFVHPTTGRRITRNQIWIRLHTLARAAGLPRDTVSALSPHKLRHARARAMLQSGFHIGAVQAVLDHASIQTTQIYVEDTETARLDTLRTLSQ